MTLVISLIASLNSWRIECAATGPHAMSYGVSGVRGHHKSFPGDLGVLPGKI
jgi:hypothetical protein